MPADWLGAASYHKSDYLLLRETGVKNGLPIQNSGIHSLLEVSPR